MYDRKLEQLLSNLKNDSQLNQVVSVSHQKTTYTFRDWLEFYVYEYTHELFKPVVLGFSTMFIFMIGFLGFQNASLNTLPGDSLYSVKLFSEKIQLLSAFSSQQRAGLHLEFASRRLEEMVYLTARENVSSESFNKIAMKANEEVKKIEGELKQSSTSNSENFGPSVVKKTETLSANLNSAKKAVQENSTEIQKVLKETEDETLNVILSTHELLGETSGSEEILKQLFNEAFEKAKLIAKGDDLEKLTQAEKLRGEGLYRRALQVLKEIEN